MADDLELPATQPFQWDSWEEEAPAEGPEVDPEEGPEEYNGKYGAFFRPV